MKKIGAFIVGLITVIAGGIAIWQALKPSGPASFSGNIGNYSVAGNFISFLSQHDSQHITLNVTCLQPASEGTHQSGPCILTGNGNEMIVYGSPAAADCWNSGASAGECSNAALLTFTQSPGASGTFSGYGAGYYFIRGDWVVRDQGSGGSSPPGDETYGLAAVTPT